jgi:hypothetical protein
MQIGGQPDPAPFIISALSAEAPRPFPLNPHNLFFEKPTNLIFGCHQDPTWQWMNRQGKKPFFQQFLHAMFACPKSAVWTNRN